MLPGGWELAHAIRLGIKPLAELGANSEALSGSQLDSPCSCRAIFESAPVAMLQSPDFRENGHSMRIPEKVWVLRTFSQQDRVCVLAASPATIFPSFIFRGIGSRYGFATVESGRAAWDGDALPHRGRAFGLPQFDNRSVQPHGGTWTWVPLQKGWWPTVQPLLDQTDGSEEQLNKAFTISQLCFNLRCYLKTVGIRRSAKCGQPSRWMTRNSTHFGVPSSPR